MDEPTTQMMEEMPHDCEGHCEIEGPPGIPPPRKTARIPKITLSKSQRSNMRKRMKRAAKKSQQHETEDEAPEKDDPDGVTLVGMPIQTTSGRVGKIILHDPADTLLELKVQFTDGQLPEYDWYPGSACGKELTVQSSAYRGRMSINLWPCKGVGTSPVNPNIYPCETSSQQHDSNDDEEDDEDILMDLPTDDGVGAQYGLTEVPGGIGVDSCASCNVMARRMLPGYRIRPSEGSKRGQRWGSASGHTIDNEGECTYRFMTETGAIKKGHTQVGEVKRPLAAVSSLTKANQIAFFCQGHDWIIDRRDPLADKIVKLVEQVKEKTAMYEHRGTYRMRAWMLPGEEGEHDAAKPKNGTRPFGRPGP